MLASLIMKQINVYSALNQLCALILVDFAYIFWNLLLKNVDNSGPGGLMWISFMTNKLFSKKLRISGL